MQFVPTRDQRRSFGRAGCTPGSVARAPCQRGTCSPRTRSHTAKPAPPRRPGGGPGLHRPCPRRALANGHWRARAVNHGSRGWVLTSPFGLRAGPALPRGSAFQARDRGPRWGRGWSATGGQHRTLAVPRSAGKRWSCRAGQGGWGVEVPLQRRGQPRRLVGDLASQTVHHLPMERMLALLEKAPWLRAPVGGHERPGSAAPCPHEA
jgi:hypothetical protein